MKLYQTHSNAYVERDNLYRVSVPELSIIRWSDEALRYTQKGVLSWEYASIPKGTTMPDFWPVT